MSEVRVSLPTEHGKRQHIDLNLGLFTLLLLLLIGGAILRSAVATRLNLPEARVWAADEARRTRACFKNRFGVSIGGSPGFLVRGAGSLEPAKMAISGFSPGLHFCIVVL